MHRYVCSLATAYCLLKPTRSMLSLWLPYYMRSQLALPEATAASCLVLYDVGALLGGMGCSTALDYLPLGHLFVPLALALSALLLSITTVAALGDVFLAGLLLVLGGTFGGLELIGSGATAGCVVDQVGGSMGGTIPSIVGAIGGLASLSSLLSVSAATALLDKLDWPSLFNAGALLALLASIALLPTLRPPPKIVGAGAMGTGSMGTGAVGTEVVGDGAVGAVAAGTGAMGTGAALRGAPVVPTAVSVAVGSIEARHNQQASGPWPLAPGSIAAHNKLKAD